MAEDRTTEVTRDMDKHHQFLYGVYVGMGNASIALIIAGVYYDIDKLQTIGTFLLVLVWLIGLFRKM